MSTHDDEFMAELIRLRSTLPIDATFLAGLKALTDPPFPKGRIWATSYCDSPTSGTTKLTPALVSTGSLDLVANRKYHAALQLDGGYYGTVAGDVYTCGIDLDGSSLGSVPVYIIVANQYIPPGSLLVAFTTTTGGHTLQGWAQRNAGTGSMQFRARVWVFDDGPV